MKKLVFIMFAVVAMCMASCGNATSKADAKDSTSVDSDSVQVDSIDSVDSLAAPVDSIAK